MTLSAWIRAAAYQRLRQQQDGAFKGTADLEEFFKTCDALGGPGQEPDWEEHLALINDYRSRGATGT